MSKTIEKRILPLDILPEDIEEAHRSESEGDPEWCPIARSMRRELGELAKSVEAGMGFLEVTYEDGETWYAETPEKAVNFMENFDEGREVKPFRFSVALKREDND